MKLECVFDQDLFDRFRVKDLKEICKMEENDFPSKTLANKNDSNLKFAFKLF